VQVGCLAVERPLGGKAPTGKRSQGHFRAEFVATDVVKIGLIVTMPASLRRKVPFFDAFSRWLGGLQRNMELRQSTKPKQLRDA
jgi:hypothetical protein